MAKTKKLNGTAKALIVVTVALIVFSTLFALLSTVLEKDYKQSDPKNPINNISYKVPEEFSTNKYDSSIYHSYYENSVSCDFDVYYRENYMKNKDGKDYLEETIRFTLKDTISDIERVSINNIEWDYIKIINKSGNITYQYATIKDNNIYELKYEIRDYKNGDHEEGENHLCYRALDSIIPTVKIK